MFATQPTSRDLSERLGTMAAHKAREDDKENLQVYFGEEMKELEAHSAADPEAFEIGTSGVEYHTVCREWRFRFTGRDVRRPSAPSPGEMTKKSAPNR